MGAWVPLDDLPLDHARVQAKASAIGKDGLHNAIGITSSWIMANSGDDVAMLGLGATLGLVSASTKLATSKAMDAYARFSTQT